MDTSVQKTLEERKKAALDKVHRSLSGGGFEWDYHIGMGELVMIAREEIDPDPVEAQGHVLGHRSE